LPIVTNLSAKLVDGYNTFVGERGIKLLAASANALPLLGQFCAIPPILVLDEATSSLDSESELLIQDAFEKLMQQKTVMCHCSSLVYHQKMDRDYVIDQNGIIEQAAHEGSG